MSSCANVTRPRISKPARRTSWTPRAEGRRRRTKRFRPARQSGMVPAKEGSMPDKSPLLAVLIDADNVPSKYAESILKEVTSYGEPGLRRVYGDWSNQQLSGWTKTAQKLGLVQHQQTANTKGKNASDIGLVIDAMDILHAGHFDGFVLVSSDSDFTRLASRIREQGLTVIGIGEAKAPDALKNACNRFVAIENIHEETAPARSKVGGLDSRRISEARKLITD